MADQVRKMSELEQEAYSAGVTCAQQGHDPKAELELLGSPFIRAAYQRGYENAAGELEHA